MTLQRLNDLVKLIDTGLKAVILTEIGNNGRISAPELAREFAENGLYGKHLQGAADSYNLRKKIEGIKATLDDFEKAGIVTRFDEGKACPQAPRYKYSLNQEHKDFIVLFDIATKTIQVSAENKIPYHFFWGLQGGSFSPELKHIRQGLELCTFYGLSTDEVEHQANGDYFQNAKPEKISGPELARRLKTSEDPKSHITKLIDAKLIEKSPGMLTAKHFDVVDKITDSRGRKSYSNTRAYWPTELGRTFVEKLFIPSLQATNPTLELNPEILNARSIFAEPELAKDYEQLVLDSHYSTLLNQNTK
jgi:hypothetical protein